MPRLSLTCVNIRQTSNRRIDIFFIHAERSRMCHDAAEQVPHVDEGGLSVRRVSGDNVSQADGQVVVEGLDAGNVVAGVVRGRERGDFIVVC